MFFFFSQGAHRETTSVVRLPQQWATEQTAHRFVLMVSVLLPVAWQHICHDSTGYFYLFNAMQETWNLEGRLGIIIQNNKRTFPSLIQKKKKKKFKSFNGITNIKCGKERILKTVVNCKHLQTSLPLLLTSMILSAALPNCSACGIDSHQECYLTSRLHITQGEALCSGHRL